MEMEEEVRAALTQRLQRLQQLLQRTKIQVPRLQKNACKRFVASKSGLLGCGRLQMSRWRVRKRQGLVGAAVVAVVLEEEAVVLVVEEQEAVAKDRCGLEFWMEERGRGRGGVGEGVGGRGRRAKSMQRLFSL
jgi:hypothetical protein